MNKLTVKELKAMASERKIEGRSKMNKEQLIKVLTATENAKLSTIQKAQKFLSDKKKQAQNKSKRKQKQYVSLDLQFFAKKESKDFTDGLNEPQAEAVVTTDGTIQICSVAGSGKTRVLTHRIGNMIINEKINPSSILVTTFTKKASEEMIDRLGSLISEEQLEELTIGTTHSIGYRILKNELQDTNFKQKKAFTKGRDGILQGWKHTKMVKDIADKLKKKYADVFEYELQEAVGSIRVPQYTKVVSFYMNNNISPQEAYNINDGGRAKMQLYKEFYEMYVAEKEAQGVIDFDDMLYLTVRLFQNYPSILKKYQNKYKYILVDEAQDNNLLQYSLIQMLGFPQYNVFLVGDDDQCVLEGSMVTMGDGSFKAIEDIKELDYVKSVSNGVISDNKVIGKSKTVKNELVKIVTQTGKEILVTPQHKLFVKNTELKGELHYVYLMWNKEFGFRIGITCNTLEQRMRQQKGSKMWVLDTCDSIQEALYKEEYYAMKYQVSKITYNLAEMGKEYTKLIFDEFGGNGYQIIDDKSLDFENPIIQTQATIRQGKKIVNINLIMGGSKGSSLNIETSDINAHAELKMLGLSLQNAKGDGKRLRMVNKDYRVLLDITKQIEKAFDKHDEIEYKTVYKAKVTGDDYTSITTASNIHRKMLIAVHHEGELILDEVVSVERIFGEFNCYDIEVHNNHNFIVNDVVSHNCMYKFRGASPQSFIDFDKNYKEVKQIFLPFNYRSNSDILDKANKLIKNNNNRIMKELIPSEITDTKSVFYNHYDDEEVEGSSIVDEAILLNQEGLNFKDMAFLYRTNAQSRAIEDSLIIKGVPYILHGGVSFYDRAEIKDLISYFQLAHDTSNNSAFKRIYNKPNRYLGNAFVEKLEQTNRSNLYNAMSTVTYGRWASGCRDIENIVRKIQDNNRKGIPMEKSLKFILENCGYKDWLLGEDFDSDADGNKMDNINTLEYLMSQFNTVAEFVEHVEKVTVNKRTSDNAVHLMTIHKSKGLEFDTVFFVGVSEGLLPHAKCLEVEEGQEDLKNNPIEEERRLAYVAVTRAEKKCYISSIGSYNGKSQMRSRFIEEMELIQEEVKEKVDNVIQLKKAE